MSRILAPSCGPSSWKGLLADPDKHWRRGRSAFETAVSWEAAQDTPRGLPTEIASLLDAQPALANATALMVLPEHKVRLDAYGRASQNDVWTLLRAGSAHISMAVEGKAGEPFGTSVETWLRDASPGKLARLEHLCGLLGVRKTGVRVGFSQEVAMKPVAEKRLLREVLRLIDRPVQPVWSARWFIPLAWVVFVLLTAIFYALGELVAHWLSAFGFVLLGMAYMFANLKAAATRAWPVLGQYVQRERIESRLRELES
jgi:hypothetical protein